jgi:alpha-tubulin suppressor-like RCC1 family protein
VWGWGDNGAGALGRGPARVTSVRRLEGRRVTALAAGAQHSLAVDADGRAWAWGLNRDGQLGDGGSRVPAPRRSVPGRWGTVTAGAAHTLAIRTDGTLWAWGANDTGQLGDTTTTDRTHPVRIGDPTWRWRTVTAGAAHTLAIRTDGTLWAWGANDWGQVGITGPETAPAPRRIGGGTWIGLAAGDMHSVALRR